MAQFKRYLPDGIEISFEGQQVILTSQTGRVYLKPVVIEALKEELRRHKRRSSEIFRRAMK